MAGTAESFWSQAETRREIAGFRINFGSDTDRGTENGQGGEILGGEVKPV